MFQLFKKRTFSSYINDTFYFFKVEGKNYMKNYFMINGGFLVLMLICFYFVFQFFYDIEITQSIGQETGFVANYLQEHIVLFSLFTLFLFALLVVMSAISYSYPTLYLKNMEKNPGKQITIEMIVTDLKKQFGRILIYILGTTFLLTPLLIILFGISFLLVFIVIGIPIIILLVPTVMSIMMISYNEYLIKQTSFFNSIGVAINMVKSNFWPIIGSTIIMYFILQIITTIFTIIPQMMMLFDMLTSLENREDYSNDGSFSILYMITMLITIIVGFILNNLLFINQGLIYYSEREVLENNQSRFDIEKLGESNE